MKEALRMNLERLRRLSCRMKPGWLLERLAERSHLRRRVNRLKGTPAQGLDAAYLGTLELLELAQKAHPKVIYDIGAFEGSWSLVAKAIFPDSRVHAFEPLAEHREGFLRTTRALSGVRLHPVALGPREGRATMNVANRQDASSLLEMAPSVDRVFGVRCEGREEVRVVELDAYAAENGIELPDLLKLDVQGWEIEVLKGASRCLAHARFVLCEVSFEEFYVGQPLFADVVSFLKDHSYRMLALSADTPVGTSLVQTDALFVKA